jgi:phosphonate transport system substrate-binding protein
MRSVFCFAALVVLMFLTPHGRAADELTLSMLPRHAPTEIQRRIEPLADYLTQALGIPVTTVLAGDYTDYEQRLRRGDIAIGYQNPLVTVGVLPAHQVRLMAVEEGSGQHYRGIVIVPTGSPLQGLTDLKGRRVMMVGRTSGGGYLSPKLALTELGIQVHRDCELSVAADNKQENVLIAVSIGEVEAGFIRENALHVADRFIRRGSVRVLGHGAWLPGWSVTLRRGLPSQVQDEVVRFLKALRDDSPPMLALGLNDFVPAADADYDVMRRLMAEEAEASRTSAPPSP